MCLNQLGINDKPAENFLYSGDITSKLKAIHLELQCMEVQDFLRGSILRDSCIFSATEVEINGHMYKPGCVPVIMMIVYLDLGLLINCE